jgi:hypothetical protein
MRLDYSSKALRSKLFQQKASHALESGTKPGAVENSKTDAGWFCAVTIHRHLDSNLKNLKD